MPHRHLVQCDTGQLFTIDQTPVDGGTAAIGRQQGAMEVEGAGGGDIQDLLLEHVAVIKREESLGCQPLDVLDPERMVDIFGGVDRQTVFGTELGHGAEEAVLARIVGVGEDGLDLVTCLEQGLDTGAADIMISKDDSFHCSVSCCEGVAVRTI